MNASKGNDVMGNLRTVILAAGKGARMKSDVPKVLHEACGKPIVEYVLDAAKAAGSLKTYVVVGYKGDAVKKQLGSGPIIVRQPKLSGTADAVRRVAGHLKNYRGDVLILCGDTPLLNKMVIKELVGKHKNSKAVCTFLTAAVGDPQGYGRIIRDERGKVVAIREDKDALDHERNIAEINVGVYCVQSRALFGALKRIRLNEKKKEFYLTDIIDLFYQDGSRIETVTTEDPVEGLGVNTKEDLAVAERVIREKILKNFMRDGVTIVDPATTYIDADVKIGKDTCIRPFTIIEKDVRIGDRCVIGPFARLRPGVRLGNGVEIGNFTEVSRTKIGNKTLMKHFSFLGDALVGSNVNIGAGTITANFDGVRKNQTKIGNGAFIGSDSILIAPVKIGNKAVVGAGSVVTKGKVVPDGGIAVGVPARIKARRERG
jgi:bifunctional UDP-N-acetylglucosamine pyrophosphorylase/glucosamine-1-phosphate N-acetyltransferase